MFLTCHPWCLLSTTVTVIPNFKDFCYLMTSACNLLFQVENVITQLHKTFPNDGLLPIFINPRTGSSAYSTITFGAMGDRYGILWLLPMLICSGICGIHGSLIPLILSQLCEFYSPSNLN